MKHGIMSALLLAGAVFGVSFLPLNAADGKTSEVALVQAGKASAEIVLPEKASIPEKYAAEELQRWIAEITGAKLPIVTPGAATAKVRLLIGRAQAEKLFANDLKAMGSRDGFAVRTKQENGVTNYYLFGAAERGTLHSVYAFLERNSDIIWARPNEKIGTIFGKTDAFSVKGGDFIDLPKSDYRALQYVWHSPMPCEVDWESRNRQNRLPDKDPKYAVTYTGAGAGHGIQMYIPAKVYMKDHPEYYPLVNGKRSAGSGQLCLTAYEMIPEYVKNIRADLKKKFKDSPDPDKERVDYLNLSIADNWVVCNCGKCAAPFVTETGKTIQPTDPVFRSAQYFTFMNKVAREMAKTNPNVTIGIYAYVFTSEPPPFQLEKNIRVEYCPFVLNEKRPIFDDTVNKKWHDYLDRWARESLHTWVRDYYGWASLFPRSQEYRIRDNTKYYVDHNVLEFSAEHPVDRSTEAYPPGEMTWDVSGMETWVIMRLWWDPYQDLEALRNMYFTRAYREGAPAMKKYHDLLRDTFYASPLPSIYSDSLMPQVFAYIIRPKIGGKLRNYLEEALAAAQHPNSKELISRQLKHLNSWIEAAGKDEIPRLNVPYSEAKGIENSFGSAVWKDAAYIENMKIADPGPDHGKTPKYRTSVKLLHDRVNLYLYFQCCTPDMKNLAVSVSRDPSLETVPRGDIMEFFLGHADTGIYYQFMFDAGNPDPKLDVVYDAKGQDGSWKGNWKRYVKRFDDRWEAIVVMPLEDIGTNITQNNKLLFQPIRGKYYDIEKNGKKISDREMASWNGGWVHEMAKFGELTLNQN